MRSLILRSLVYFVVGVASAHAQSFAPSIENARHWSFQKVTRPPVPNVKDVGKVHSPVDAFVLEKLEAKGLTFSPEADKASLIWRVLFGLNSLPPSPEEVPAFVASTSPAAYE